MKESKFPDIKKPNTKLLIKMIFLNFGLSFLWFSSTLVASISMIFLYDHQGLAVTIIKGILAGVSIFIKIFPIQKMLKEFRQIEGEEGNGTINPIPYVLVILLALDISGLIYIYYVLESPEFFLTMLGAWVIISISMAFLSYRGYQSYYERFIENDIEEEAEDPYKYGRR
jgi:hypothetical protein